MTSTRGSLGIIGGLGPIASAEFLKTIYEFNTTVPEQGSPRCVLVSDPTFPDRTLTILENRDPSAVVERLQSTIAGLSALGVDRIVIACVTMHHFLAYVPEHARSRVISLLDIVFDALEKSPGRRVLLCTTGTRRAGIFQSHPRWKAVERQLVLPQPEDQQAVHDMIYELKVSSSDVGRSAAVVERLMEKLRVEAFVAGCTEIHLLSKYYVQRADPIMSMAVDPLMILARELERFFDA